MHLQKQKHKNKIDGLGIYNSNMRSQVKNPNNYFQLLSNNINQLTTFQLNKIYILISIQRNLNTISYKSIYIPISIL